MEMKKEPSLLLIDDMQQHDHYLRMMDLDKEGWAVESVIEQTVKKALAEACGKIRQYGGFSVIVLDMLWPHGKLHGGIEIWRDLVRRHGGTPPARKVVIVTRKAVNDDPKVKEFADKLNIPANMRTLMLETPSGRHRLKEYLRSIWQEISNGAV